MVKDGIRAALLPLVMNIKSILASLVFGVTGVSLVAGVSSEAMAAPSATVTAKAPARSAAAVRDHRVVSPPIMQPTILPARVERRGSWGSPSGRAVTLGSSLHFAGDGRTFLDVGAQLGRFDRLQISGAGGRTLIKQVYVELEDGQEQSIRNINRVLSGNETMTLDLDGNRRGIRRIVVYGNALNSGWRMPAGTFTVTAL